MKSNTKYTFTVRNNIKEEPRITQELIFLEEKDYNILIYLRKLINNDKLHPKFLKEIKLEYIRLLNGNEFITYFSVNCFYFKCLGKWVESKEGWYNLKIK